MFSSYFFRDFDFNIYQKELAERGVLPRPASSFWVFEVFMGLDGT
jgi:hypothetical protein